MHRGRIIINEHGSDLYHFFKRKSTWTPDKNREPALDLFIHLITKDILNTKPLKIADNLTKQEREALKNLTERNDIVIKPSDKGKATVIMDTEKYKAECYRQLNDPKFYKRLPKDITHQVEDRIRIRLKRLLIDDEIEEDANNYLVPHRSRPARFYILPKIYKNKDTPSQNLLIINSILWFQNYHFTSKTPHSSFKNLKAYQNYLIVVC